MTKNYNSPMLQIFSIKNSDIITNSPMGVNGNYGTGAGITLGAPGLRDVYNDWDAGY